jgi:hypothetical protein
MGMEATRLLADWLTGADNTLDFAHAALFDGHGEHDRGVDGAHLLALEVELEALGVVGTGEIDEGVAVDDETGASGAERPDLSA